MDNTRYSASFVVGVIFGLLLIKVLKGLMPVEGTFLIVFKLLIIMLSISLVALIVEIQNARISKLRKAKKRIKEALFNIQAYMKISFPNGEKDINAAANELMLILKNQITQNKAKEIVRLSVGIRLLSENHSIERLRQHLSGYCLHHFTESQVEDFHRYLNTLNTAILNGKSPSEIKRSGDRYIW